jgi:DNA helicase-2/ATP-dependent DNA helicase PcrA
LLFGETYKDAKLIKLEENYRSSGEILNLINDTASNISLGYNKKLFTSVTSLKTKPQVYKFKNDYSEAEFIGDEIIRLKNIMPYNKMSVLCRASYQSNFVQAEFLKRNIPFIMVGGIKFIEKKHIKDLIAYVKIIWNPADAISWHRVLTLLKGIGEGSANKIIEKVQNNEHKIDSLVSFNFSKNNEQLRELYNALNEASKETSILGVLNILIDYYKPILKSMEDDWKIRIEDFKVLKKLAIEYKTIDQFLSNLALDPPNDSNAAFAGDIDDQPTDCVTISTIHSSKGLEWNTVFVISLLDGAVPSYKAFEDFEQMEEERKLFYVACSRAKESLYLTLPSYLSTYTAFFDQESRFLKELEKDKYIFKDKSYYD